MVRVGVRVSVNIRVTRSEGYGHGWGARFVASKRRVLAYIDRYTKYPKIVPNYHYVFTARRRRVLAYI